MSFKFLNDGQDGVQRVSPIDTFIDPVSKIRVSNPSNLIDTDFEYGLQPTKWETVELINNTPAFFSKGGDTTIPDITAITTNAGTREITVTTAFPHNLDVGIPIRVSGTKSVTADGSYIINATPTNLSFTYLARGDQDETVSIFDLYTSIITGEFFQGSQISIDAAEGITTDGASPSVLTVKTENKHGFGPNTPFYFLNLNSTIAQEFEAQNTATVSFDPTNSSTAQTFDGSNTLLQTPIDLSNSATTSILNNSIASIDAQNSTITVNINAGDAANWANLKEGDSLYYDVTSGGGYFQNNPRGVVFIKSVENLISNDTATFQVSQLPNGDAIPTLSNTTGIFKIADQARTFAGNNQDPETQIDLSIVKESASTFDGGNEETVFAGVQGYSGTTINLLVAQGTIDYYPGAMLLYSTDGNAPAELSNNATYFVTSFAEGGQAGLYSMSIAELPGENPIDFTTTGSGTQTFKQIGISIDKNIVHIKDANFSVMDMLQYEFPENGNFGADFEKSFYFVTEKFDTHNYSINDQPIAFIEGSGGDVTETVNFEGQPYTVHRFTQEGSSTFEIVNAGTFDQEIKYVVSNGSFDGNAGTLVENSFLSTKGVFDIVVNAGGRVDIAYPQDDGANSIPFNVLSPIPINATGGSVSDITINSIDYRVHSFTNTGNSTFTVNSVGNFNDEVEVLVLAGGGHGGSNMGGGGGAGGMIEQTFAVTPQAYTLTVGVASTSRISGTNSVLAGLTALGGGFGGNDGGGGASGGSGGGAGRNGGGSTGLQPNSASGGFGNGAPGATGGGNWGSGGGGAGSAAGRPAGGAGRANSITGTSLFYAGGGGGGSWVGDNNPGAGGSGVGGNGSTGNGLAASPQNRGSGGGGGGEFRAGGDGSHGVVIVRYPLQPDTGGL